jgi:hypothetical protein
VGVFFCAAWFIHLLPKSRSCTVMKETQTLLTVDDPEDTSVLPATIAGDGDTQALHLALAMESPTSLLTVLTTVARLGGRLTSIHATEQRATLSMLAPRRVAHRLRPCLGEVIGVVSVEEFEVARRLETEAGALAEL